MFERSGFVLLSAYFVFLEHPGMIVRGMDDAVATKLDVSNVLCDATHYCPDGTTCCKLTSGGYGCCPAPNAVCCSDGIHCCPQGYLCNGGMCSRDGDIIKAATKIASKDIGRVWCDPTHRCHDGNTCCIHWPSGGFSCCPIAHAVCFADGEHCCAQGYTFIGDMCYKAPNEIIKAVKTIISQDISDVFCDATHSCPDGSTCCKLASGEYGCCPVPNAVCCSDGIHCCPHGYTCNGNMCSKAGDVLKAVDKIASQDVSNVHCDATHYCPNGTTCCKQASGGYGCCPAPNAVCCSDGIHCCPHGYTCNGDMCSKDGNAIKEINKIASQDIKDVWCNPTHHCPDENTCCIHYPSGEYSCCPIAHAVCCADGEHCCAKGYTCFEDRCYKAGKSIKAAKSVISQDKPAKVPRNLVDELDDM